MHDVLQSQSFNNVKLCVSVSDPYSFFPDPEVEAGDQYGSGFGSNPDLGL
jgi:hypothetical protein